MEEIKSYISDSDNETAEIGFGFAHQFQLGDIIALYGGLGAGKTELIKGICKYFHVNELVTSPTFSVINQYFGTIDEQEIIIYHIDLYRIKSPKELDEIGFFECINSENAIKLIEWADKAIGILPDNHFQINIGFSPDNEDKRIIEIKKV